MLRKSVIFGQENLLRMKRFLLVCVVTFVMCGNSYGWGILEHGAVAQIAENHLSPEAKTLLKGYLKGVPMAYYSYDAEIKRDEMFISVGDKKWLLSHTFNVDKKFASSRKVFDKNGEPLNNMLADIDLIVKDLKANHREMTDSVRQAYISFLIHAVGDMHCPMHVGFEDRAGYGQYTVYFGKTKKMNYHTFWDKGVISAHHPWSYSDLATLFDIYNEKEIASFCKGDIFTWGKEVAKTVYPMHSYRANARIDVVKYRVEYQQTGELLLTKAGYRLAKLLNEIFQ